MRILWVLLIFIFACSFSSEKEESVNEESGGLTGNFQTPDIPQESEFNRLSQQEEMLARRRGGAGESSSLSEENSAEKADSICRRFSGCIRVCSRWFPQDKNCKQQPAGAVISLWVNSIGQSASEQVIQQLEWIAQDVHVSSFLYALDSRQQVLAWLVSQLSYEQCPLLESRDIFYEITEDRRAVLYLAHPEGPEKGVKKIIDSAVYGFNFLFFKGLMNRCLAGQSQNFLERAAAHRNQIGLALGVRLLHSACGSSIDCMRLAYCKLDPVSSVDEVLGQPHLKFSQSCAFDDFHSLPKEIKAGSS